MIVVIGSGFGLYGHVAALAAASLPVSMPARYRQSASARPELSDVVDRTNWVADEWSAIAHAKLTCLACRPADNLVLAERMVSEAIGGILVLEKPIAPTWQLAQSLEQAMVAAGRRWRTPYLFLYCEWYSLLEDGLARGERVVVRWCHHQRPGVRDWKVADRQGGGAINFYFIHWLAVLEALLPDIPARFSNEFVANEEHIGFTATDGARQLDVFFELGDAVGFEINVGGRVVHRAGTPFGEIPEPGRTDPRIPALQRFYQAVLSGEDSQYDADFQMAVTRRWRDIRDD